MRPALGTLRMLWRHLAVLTYVALCLPASMAASVGVRQHAVDEPAATPRQRPLGRGVAPPAGILINEARACEPKPFALIFVHSAPNNAAYRSAIRKSWGSVGAQPGSGARVLFVLGAPPDGATSRRIRQESAANRDVLQFDVDDVYENLASKSVAMLRWAADYCSGVRYLVKADDDTFVNAPLLVADLRHVVHRRFVMGDIIAGARPIRDRRSKYYTPASQYNHTNYPTYLSGAAYVISGDLITSLVEAARSTELFWLEDVFVTGLLARRAKAKHIFNGKFAFRIQTLGKCQLNRIIALHRVKPDEMINAWLLIDKMKENCRSRS